MERVTWLSEAIRPGDRDQCGKDGESLHQMADILTESGYDERVARTTTEEELARKVGELNLPSEQQVLQKETVRILQESAARQPITLGEYLAQNQ